nr:tetratricopeptide repeat protein [Bacteroidota bacterium]
GEEKINTLNLIAAGLVNSNPDKALEYATDALNYAHETKYVEQKAFANINIGDVYFYKNNYQKARPYYKIALDLYTSINNPEGVAKAILFMAINSDEDGLTDQAIDEYHRSLKIYDSLNYHQEVADIFYDLGILVENIGKKAEALQYYQNSLKKTEQINNKAEIANIRNTIGVLYYDWGQYETALEYYQSSLKLMEELNNKEGIAQTINNIGILYYDWGNKEKALEYYLSSMEIEKEINNEKGLSGSYNNIGIIYADLHEHDKAMDYYLKSLAIEENMRSKAGMATALNNIGELYFELGKGNLALEALKRSLQLEKETGNASGIAIAFNTLGEMYLKSGKPKTALLYNDSSFMLSQSMSLMETLITNFKNYSLIHESLGNYKKALTYHLQFTGIKDSVFNKNIHEQITLIQSRYEFEKKEKEIELLNSDNKFHQLELDNKSILVKRQQILLIASLSGFLLILAALIVLFRQINQKKKAFGLLKKQNQEILNNRNELVKAKEKAEESDKLKSIFLANISHELRTPLNGILGFAEILQTEISEPVYREMAEVINSSGKRLLTTLNSIIDLSIIESRQMDLNKTTVFLDEFVREMVMLSRVPATRKSLFVEFTAKAPGITLFTDPKILNNLLHNLVDNAIKYTRKGGVTVEIDNEIRGDTEWAIINIIDTGIGIPKNYVSQIFDKFRQGSEGHNREYEGAGLGLTICKKYTELINGELYVKSVFGEGSVFSLKLPVSESEISKDIAPKITFPENINLNETIPDQRCRVLIVENDEINMNFMAYNLKNICAVDTATDAQSAIGLVKQHQYSAILMDINLGARMNGMKCAQEIRMMPGYANIPIAAVTANAMKGQREEFLSNGCTHYLAKPFGIKEFQKFVTDLITMK